MLTAATSNTSGSGISNATSESFSYNDRGDLLTASGTAGSTNLAYNGDGLLASTTDASGTSSYGYDSSDRLHTVTEALTGTTHGGCGCACRLMSILMSTAEPAQNRTPNPKGV
jgi:YD repeat-containing protein